MSPTGGTASWVYRGARGVPEPGIRRPQCAQDACFWAPRASKRPLGWFNAFPRRLQEPLETPQDRPRWPKTRPRRLQDVLLVPSGRRNVVKLAPRSHAEAILGRNPFQPQNSYFCNTRKIFLIFGWSKKMFKS